MTIQKNKEVVIRFNKEFLESGNVEITKELLADNFANHFAPKNGPDDVSVMVQFLTGFRKGFSDVTVQFSEVLGEVDKVSLVKTMTGTHTGDFMGKSATGKKAVINVVEINLLKDGKITDIWSLSNFQQVIQAL